MTYDDAVTVAKLAHDAFPNERDWNADQITMYAQGIERLDAEYATKAVLKAQSVMTRRPTVADLIAIARSIRADNPGPRYDAVPEDPPRKPKTIPPWVKEWMCARYLYASFGRNQDMRRFTEQQDWANPNTPLMPRGEWAKEAASLSDGRAWTVFRAGA